MFACIRAWTFTALLIFLPIFFSISFLFTSFPLSPPLPLSSSSPLHCNVRRIVELNTNVQESEKSAFAVAILAGNNKVAMRILYYTDGKADLSNCHLKKIPEYVIHLTRANLISTLDISNNEIQLQSIPPDIYSIHQLITTNNTPNQNSTTPRRLNSAPGGPSGDIIQQLSMLKSSSSSQNSSFNPLSLMAFQSNKSPSSIPYKVIIIGSPHSGKTSLFKVSFFPFFFPFLFSFSFFLPLFPSCFPFSFLLLFVSYPSPVFPFSFFVSLLIPSFPSFC